MTDKLDYYVPHSARKGQPTYLTIAAHEDDIEFMAYDGILRAFDGDGAFYAVVTTDGAGSARSGIYQKYTDEDMKRVRAGEQKKAAEVGEYGALYLLNYTSAEAKAANRSIVDDYVEIIDTVKPDILYTHNPLDKHDTHVGVCLKVIEAVRRAKHKPHLLYGCEVWRGLDWVCDEDKLALDVSAHPNLANALMGVFDSQIAGGKRYDAATVGRRNANATYGASHSVDTAQAVSYALDMTRLIESGTAEEYAAELIEHFHAEQAARLNKLNK